MISRRRKGATLGLVAVSVLVIILIGVGCFFLAKIAGGGREVANATDAGTLQVAKVNLRSAAASVPMPAQGPLGYTDFAGCGDTLANGNITLFTYNRAVSQALIVALNAEQEGPGAPAATAYANALWAELGRIGRDLGTLLETQGTSQNVFLNVANKNSTKMFGSNPVNEVDYKWAFMRKGGSTNVWFSQYTFGQTGVDADGNPISYNFTKPNGIVNSGTIDLAAPANKTAGISEYSPYRDLGPGGNEGNKPLEGKFMAGYQAIGPVLGHTFVGVPVFPMQKPHLVSLREFEDANQTFVDPNGWAPPNAFKVTTSSQDSKSSTMGGAVACAIVGAVNQFGASGTTSCDFLADIPYGYLLITNQAEYGGGGPPAWNVPDNSGSIFNWELNPMLGPNPTSGGIAVTGGNGGDVFFADSGSAPQTVQQWVDYNTEQARQGWPQPAGAWVDSTTGQTQTSPPSGSLAGIYITSDGNNQRAAQQGDLMGTGPSNPGVTQAKKNCLDDLVQNNWDGPEPGPTCARDLNAFTAAMNRTPLNAAGGTPTADMGRYWSAVDQVKMEIIRAMGSRRYDRVLPPTTTGLGAYEQGGNPVYVGSGNVAPVEAWNGGNPPPLEHNSTVYDLLKEVGGCATSSVLSDIWQRCNEIAPGTSSSDVARLLSSPSAQLGMGGVLYIYRQNPTDSASPLQITATRPLFLSNGLPSPDGDPNQAEATCHNGPYAQAAGTTLNTPGDAGVGVPFPRGSSSITTQDFAKFTLSSGNHGLLGKLDFSQTSAGEAHFSRPN